MTATVAVLNDRFAIPDRLLFKESPTGLIVAEIDTPEAEASLCLQGGHVMRWRPKTEAEPVVWLSQDARLAPGKSIRGGVPVCWPWFGAHATEAKWPAHGYARTVPWEVLETAAHRDGAIEMVLRLVESDQTRAMWPHRTELTLRVGIGRTFKAALTTTNRDTQPVQITEALHTYFQIGDIAETQVRGLEGCEYADKVRNFTRQRQQGAISFAAETDRVYLNTESECVIDDARLKRRIRIAGRGSRSVVVWTPWQDKADTMGDLGPGQGWRRMVCVESANALDNAVTIAGGGSHTLAVEYRVERD